MYKNKFLSSFKIQKIKTFHSFFLFCLNINLPPPPPEGVQDWQRPRDETYFLLFLSVYKYFMSLAKNIFYNFFSKLNFKIQGETFPFPA